jgi:hypothetical protein
VCRDDLQNRHVTVDHSCCAREAFDHPDRVFEVKFDGFRTAADTVGGQLISCNGNRMARFEEVLNRFRMVTCSTANWSCSTIPEPST